MITRQSKINESLEALGRLGHGPERDAILAVLRRYAAMWLVQLPGLVSETELERLHRQTEGAPPARMMRELAQALEVLAADTPLVLVLEDLHWSDRSTVELLAYLGQRREPARLLVLGIYRPVDLVIRTHPLRGMVQELCGRGQAVEMHLEFLPAEDVRLICPGAWGGGGGCPLAAFVYERTEGNALFVMGAVAHARGDFLAARAHLEHSCRLADAVPSPAPFLRGGFVRGVTLRTALARVLWTLGYDEQARQRSQEALTLARWGDHSPTLAFAEHNVALVCQFRRDVAATQAHVDALLVVAAMHHLAFRAEQGRCLQGWTLAMQGEPGWHTCARR